MQYIAQADPSHSGYQHIVKSLDSFKHVGPHGEHTCIVFESLGESVLDLQKRWEKGRLSLELVRSIARQTLMGLDYLHRSCGLVHTGT
jgi:serine/threonine-protein kinase SRPK3